MRAGSRPVSVTILACVYIAAGALGFAFHFSELPALDAALIELVRLLAVVCGAFLLLGRNWARWLALAWMAFHVVVSAFHSLPELATHLLFCCLIAWILFRAPAARYFGI